MGYGKDYKYAHNYEGHFVEQQNLPNSLVGREYYTPGEQGYEKQVASRMRKWWHDRRAPQEQVRPEPVEPSDSPEEIENEEE